VVASTYYCGTLNLNRPGDRPWKPRADFFCRGKVPNPGRIGGEFPNFRSTRFSAYAGGIASHLDLGARCVFSRRKSGVYPSAYLLRVYDAAWVRGHYQRQASLCTVLRPEHDLETHHERVWARTLRWGHSNPGPETTSRYIAWTRRHGRGRGGLRRESAAIRSIMRIRVLSAAATSLVPIHVLLVVIHWAAMPVTVILARMRGLF